MLEIRVRGGLSLKRAGIVDYSFFFTQRQQPPESEAKEGHNPLPWTNGRESLRGEASILSARRSWEYCVGTRPRRHPWRRGTLLAATKTEPRVGRLSSAHAFVGSSAIGVGAVGRGSRMGHAGRPSRRGRRTGGATRALALGLAIGSLSSNNVSVFSRALYG